MVKIYNNNNKCRSSTKRRHKSKNKNKKNKYQVVFKPINMYIRISKIKTTNQYITKCKQTKFLQTNKQTKPNKQQSKQTNKQTK